MVLHFLNSFPLLFTSPRLNQPTNVDSTAKVHWIVTQFASLAGASKWQNSQRTQAADHKHSASFLLLWHNVFPTKEKHYSRRRFYSLTLALQHLLAPALLSSSAIASFLLLHTMVHSSTSNALQQEYLHCLHPLLVAWLLPNVVIVVVLLVNLQRSQSSCWFASSSSDELRLL